MTADGAADHSERLAQRYLDRPYPWYGGRDQSRLKVVTKVEKFHTVGG